MSLSIDHNLYGDKFYHFLTQFGRLSKRLSTCVMHAFER